MPRPLVFGRSPTQNVVALRRRFEPMLHVLQKVTGDTLQLRIGASYDATLGAMLDDQFDFALVGPGLWLDAHDAGANYLPVLQSVRRGERCYRGCVVSLAGRFANMTELRGKRLAFVNRASVGGYASALPLFADAGLTLDDFTGRFVGGHDNVLRALCNDDADAGVVFEGAWTTFDSGTGQPLQVDVLGTSADIPSEPICVSERLRLDDPTRAHAIERALMDLHSHQAGKDALAAQHEGLERYVRVDVDTYLHDRARFGRARPMS